MRVEVADELPAHEVDVGVDRMKTMAALLADPNPIHWDTRAVARLGMGERPVNQGPLNMGYLQTMLARWAGGRDRLLDFRVRFLGNVFDGDRVRAAGTVTAVRDDGRGGRVADCEVRLDVVGGDTVMQGTATVALSEESDDE